MAVDERTRHEPHQRLDQVLGVEQAATLMSHLPPTGWGDVVTREHLDLRLSTLEARIDARLDGHDARFEEVLLRFDQWGESITDRLTAAFRAELNQAVVAQTRLLIVALFTSLAAIAGVMFGVLQLAG
jgi:hypothetical protein